MVRIALVAKYIRIDSDVSDVFKDAYASVLKALYHAAMFGKRKLEIEVRGAAE